MDHPSIFALHLSKKIGSTLELNSEAPVLLTSDQVKLKDAGSSNPAWKLVGLSGFEPLTSRLSGVRSNQTEL